MNPPNLRLPFNGSDGEKREIAKKMLILLKFEGDLFDNEGNLQIGKIFLDHKNSITYTISKRYR